MLDSRVGYLKLPIRNYSLGGCYIDIQLWALDASIITTLFNRPRRLLG